MTTREFTALRLVDKARWAALVHQAMLDAEGHIPQAAEALGVSVSTMYRWLADPCFRKLRTPRAPQGVAINPNGGRPRKDGT